MKISKNDFGQIVGHCWSKETALDPTKRSQQDPSYSHDLLTALLANEILDLPVCIEAHTISDEEWTIYHFFNNDGNDDIRFCKKPIDWDIPATRKTIMDDKDVALLVDETKDVIKKRYNLFKSKFEKQIYNTLIDWYIQDFINERFDNIDDLPKKLLLPNDPNYDKYKCRTIRWTNISFRLQLLPLKLPSISDATKQEIKTFQEYIKSLDYSEFRTKEEIDKANAYLENIITLLRAEKSIQKLKGIAHKKRSKKKEKENQI